MRFSERDLKGSWSHFWPWFPVRASISIIATRTWDSWCGPMPLSPPPPQVIGCWERICRWYRVTALLVNIVLVFLFIHIIQQCWGNDIWSSKRLTNGQEEPRGRWGYRWAEREAQMRGLMVRGEEGLSSHPLARALPNLELVLNGLRNNRVLLPRVVVGILLTTVFKAQLLNHSSQICFI